MLIWDFQKAISLHKGYKALQIAIIIIIDVAVLHNIALFWNEPRAWGNSRQLCKHGKRFLLHKTSRLPYWCPYVNNESVAMLVSQTSPAGVQLFLMQKRSFVPLRSVHGFIHSTFNIFYFISFKNRKSQIILLVSFSCLKFYRCRTLIYVKETHRFIELLVKITYFYLYS